MKPPNVACFGGPPRERGRLWAGFALHSLPEFRAPSEQHGARPLRVCTAPQVKEDPAEFYGTTGNHNDWDVDRMQEGNVRSA